MFMKYLEPQGRAGAAGGRPEWKFLTELFFCQIQHFLGSEDRDSALKRTGALKYNTGAVGQFLIFRVDSGRPLRTDLCHSGSV